MRKLVLTALAGTAIALAVPQFASATPLAPAPGLGVAADTVSSTTQVWHRRWHRGGHRGYCWRHPRRC